MGTYVYTLRKKPIKAIDIDTGAPIEIGVTDYAYKESYAGWPGYNRQVGRTLMQARRAREANPNLVLVTYGRPSPETQSVSVYRVKPTLAYFYDTNFPGEHVGYMLKKGRKWIFQRDAMES